jgi:corrinoid protein of di/trimethylamine methyltransferase
MTRATVAGDVARCIELARQGLAAGIAPIDALQKGFARGMHIIGDQFSRLECFLPEVMMAADAMNAAVDVLKPHLLGQATGHRGTVVLGTMQGDLHDLGKNIVKIMLQADGFSVHDLGRDVPVRDFIEKAAQVRADIIAASAILTITMAHMPDLAKVLAEMGLRDNYRIMLGGAPVIRQWALESAGADGYGEDAIEAVAEANRLMALQRKQGGTRS